MEILFTYDNEERKTSYVFFFDPASPDDIIPMRYNEDGTLEEIEERLMDLGFFRVHRSFLVSVNKIKKFSRESLALENGEELPVGKTYYKKVKERLEEQFIKI